MKRLKLLALIAVLPIAGSTFADTLTLRDGRRFEGAFVTGSRTVITFRDDRGVSRNFPVKNVESLKFSSATDATFRNPSTGSAAKSTSSAAYVTIPSGTELAVRTNDPINSKTAAVGQKFSAVIDGDILDQSGTLAIPKGSAAELVIRQTTGGSMTKTSELILDVDSLTVGGRRYLVTTGDLQQKGRQGIGTNKRTAVMVGGGAALGTLIGAIAGGGKGAAIGAGVGAGAGAGVQVLTKGKEVQVPAETLLKFKLEQDLRLAPAR